MTRPVSRTSYEVRWPIDDDTIPLNALIREAAPELHAIAADARVMVIPPVTWTVGDTDDGLELVAAAGACLLDDVAESARVTRAVAS